MEITRRIVQLLALLAANPWLSSFWNRRPIYQGPLKNICFPGLNCYSCPAAAMACPLGAMQNFISTLAINIKSGIFQPGFYVIGTLGIVGSLVGRAPCAWLCPFGLFQEVIYKLPVKKRDIWRPLRAGRYLFLIFFVLLFPLLILDETGFGRTWFCKYVCPAGTIEAGIPLLVMMPPLREAAGWLFVHKVSVLLIIMAWSSMTLRPFCRTICPLGLVLGWFNRVSWLKLKFKKDRCVECRVCTAICPAGVSFYDGRDDINSSHCIRCMRCLNICPGASLEVSFSPVLKEEVEDEEKTCSCHR